MKVNRCIGVVACSWLVWGMLCAGAVAATYYVDVQRGDDTQDGSATRPFRSIGHALRTATAPGDVVYVAPGFYEGDAVDGFGPRAGVAVLGAGPGRTIVSGGGEDLVLVGFYTEDLPSTTRIEGFTFQDAGGGIGDGCSSGFARFVLRNSEFRDFFWDPVASFSQFDDCEFAPLIENNVFLAGWPSQNILEFYAHGPSGLMAPIVRGNVFGTLDPDEPHPDMAVLQSTLSTGRSGITVEENRFLDCGIGLLLDVNLTAGWDGDLAEGAAVFRRNRCVWSHEESGMLSAVALAGRGRPATITGENNLFDGPARAFVAQDWDDTAPPILVESWNDTIHDSFWGGLRAQGAGSVIRLHNAILWNIASGPDEPLGGTVFLDWSDVQGGWPGSGNIDLDPAFVDPLNGVLELSAGSPAIDAGTSDGAPPADIEGRSRYDDPATADTGDGGSPWYDMGAFEFRDDVVADCPQTSVPEEVRGLRVWREPSDEVHLAWEPESRSNLYRLATGRIEDLRPSGFFAASCPASTSSLEIIDGRPSPGGDSGWWYLVRGEGDCGVGPFGDSTLDPDPRDELDAWFPYEVRPCP